MRLDEPKEECDRCGFEYYTSLMNDQDGIRVCPECLDDDNPQDEVQHE